MYFVVLATDKPGAAEIRAGNRADHLAYLETYGKSIIAGGATLSDDGESMTGSFLLVDVEDRAAAEAFSRNDPFAKAGLFESVEIRRWRKVIFQPPED